jgi:UPF0755 protein
MKQQGMLRKKISFVLIGISVFILAFAGYIFFMPNYNEDIKGKIVTISRGASFHTVADSLASAGVINNKWSFQLAGRLLGYTKIIKTGKYLFTSGQSNLAILKDIRTGTSRMIIPVTIPEGWRFEQIAHRYQRDLGIDEEKFIALCKDEKLIREHNISSNSLEGFLMPETYSFYWQTDEKEIIERMLEGFSRFFKDSLINQQNKSGYTQLQIITLASIVESESNLDTERPTIAGVYLNRLKNNKRLEADPTVQYALGEGRRLNYQDLNVDSPYNTYRHAGLPPGPINNPGKSSILAVLYPQQHNYLYFVATGVGGHRFAKNYSEHQNNIQKYKRARREMQRASVK